MIKKNFPGWTKLKDKLISNYFFYRAGTKWWKSLRKFSTWKLHPCCCWWLKNTKHPKRGIYSLQRITSLQYDSIEDRYIVLSTNINNNKCSPELIFFKRKTKKIQTFKIDWMSDFGTKYNKFFQVCWFLAIFS